MRAISVVLATLILFAPNLRGQSSPPDASLQWAAVPAILPPGALIAVVSGDPTKPGPCTVKLSMPDGYRKPPHYPPVDEVVKVEEGTLLIGMGDKLDKKKTQEVPAGQGGTAPAGAHHYTIAKGRTIVSVTFIGPYTITYLNAYEAPRKVAFPYNY